MTSIEIRVLSVYDDLNDSEKKAATYFLNHVDSVFSLPIVQLAEQANTTQVAWVRLCKQVGFSGLKELKKALFSELNESVAPAPRQENLFYTDISDYNTVTEMIQAVKTSSICAIEDTMKLLDPNLVALAADHIVKSDSVKLFGINASALVAQDFFYKLIRIGKPACFAQDLHVQLTYASTLGPNDVGFFVSNSGTTQELIECLRLAKERGGTIIALTRYDHSPLAQEADICLFTSSPEIFHRSGAMSSRIAQMAAIDVLFTAVARQNYDQVEIALQNSYKSCMRHRIHSSEEGL